ncbi:MAG: CRISPR system precrRNA processing endoribonuclease RAMP protein Cas6 [Cyanobacteria bacterium P01_D01_bin.1]
MPQSLILKLTAQSAIAPRYQQGQAPQQLFFALIEAVDPRLGQILQCDPTNRSYSLSTLQYAHPPQSADSLKAQSKARSTARPHSRPKIAKLLQYKAGVVIPAQTQCWWRITFLDDLLFDSIASLWQSLLGERFDLGTAHLTIDEVITKTPIPKRTQASTALAAACSYSELYAQASDSERNIHIEFVTPTVFEYCGLLSPMPSAENLFHPLRRCWNHYSDLLFPASLIGCLSPTYFDIRTCSVQSFLQSPLPNVSGCIGKIGFRIGEQHRSSTVKHINALADFARFCSVGHQAQFGMGVLGRSHLSLARSASRSASNHARTRSAPSSSSLRPATACPKTNRT